jgi:phage gp36-like protein
LVAYCTDGELTTYGAPATAFGTISLAIRDGAREAASRIVDSFLRGRYALPLIAWGTEITETTARIAAYNLLNVRGYNPAAGADTNIRDRYIGAILWLKDVQRRAAHPDVTPATADAQHQSPRVLSSSVVGLGSGRVAANRGW